MLFWAVLVLATLLLACWLLRLSAWRADLTPRKRQFLAATGGALLACAIWSLYHLTSFSSAGSIGMQHPNIMLGVSLVVAMLGCGLAVGNVALLLDKQASSKASSGIDALTGLQTRSQLEISIGSIEPPRA